MNAIKQALAIAEKLKNEPLADEQKFGIAVTLAAAGLGVAKFLITNGRVNQVQATALRNDIQLLLNELDQLMQRH